MSEWRENQAQRSSGNNYGQPKTVQVETIGFCFIIKSDVLEALVHCGVGHFLIDISGIPYQMYLRTHLKHICILRII